MTGTPATGLKALGLQWDLAIEKLLADPTKWDADQKTRVAMAAAMAVAAYYQRIRGILLMGIALAAYGLQGLHIAHVMIAALGLYVWQRKNPVHLAVFGVLAFWYYSGYIKLA